MEIQNGRGQIIQEPRPTTAVVIVIFVCTVLLFVATVAYHKTEEKRTSTLIEKELNKKNALTLSNKEKDEKIEKLTPDARDASILKRKLDSVMIKKDTAVAHAIYWQARYRRVKVALNRERAKNKDTSVLEKK